MDELNAFAICAWLDGAESKYTLVAVFNSLHITRGINRYRYLGYGGLASQQKCLFGHLIDLLNERGLTRLTGDCKSNESDEGIAPHSFTLSKFCISIRT
jgi:hypothetical protein